ncbi:MAG: helix-turn-helix domain-containing protein [Chthoniobacterales bacterium]
MATKPRFEESPHQEVFDLSVDEFHISQSNIWRSQGTRDWLLILTVGGKGIIRSGNAEVESTAGTITLYQPDAPQHYFVDPETGDWHTLWSHFYAKPHWSLWLNWPEMSRGFRSLVIRDSRVLANVCDSMRSAVRFGRQRLPGSSDFAANSLEQAILWINSVNQHRDLDERIRKVADLMAEKLREPISLESLARDGGISASRLWHLFTSQMGMTPGKYLESLRMQRAVQLLRSTELSVTQIADEVGYASPFYFSNRFKKEFRKSPTEFRESLDK